MSSSDRPTGRPPRLSVSEWKSWVLLAALFVTPPGVSTAVLTIKLDGLQAAVSKNTAASDKNTAAVNAIKVDLAERNVTSTRLSAVEGQSKDHETRLRALEQR